MNYAHQCFSSALSSSFPFFLFLLAIYHYVTKREKENIEKTKLMDQIKKIIIYSYYHNELIIHHLSQYL